MTTPNDQPMTENVTPPAPAPAAGRDIEGQTAAGPVAGGGGKMKNIMRRWKSENFMSRASLASRLAAFVFSLLAFIIMASNKHGDWKNFDRYEEYRYLLAIAILSTLYTGLQALRQFRELSTGRVVMFSPKTLSLICFFGDQIMAYLLISAASSAVPLTNRMREGADNIFTDSSATAIAMAFFAFFCLAVSSLISGYKLSNQTYI